MTSRFFRNDPMFLRNQFAGTGALDMPMLGKEKIALEKIQLVGYDKLNENAIHKIVHFFLDNYKFEAIWKDPLPRVERLRPYRAVLTPNYSLYEEMPQPLKIFNTFRSRWCGAFLQEKGLRVLPTVAWGQPDTYWFCFDGLPKGATVAVSTLGVRMERTMFLQGYEEMLRRVEPDGIICYGRTFPEMGGNVVEVDYAKTNHLCPDTSKSFYVWKTHTDTAQKGMGLAGGGGGRAKLPPNDSQLKHILRDKKGHLPDTPENRATLERLANDESKYWGTDQYGNRWYVDQRADGQYWVVVRGDQIQEGGRNIAPIEWDAKTGLNRNPGKWFGGMGVQSNPFSHLFQLTEVEK